MTDEQKHQNRQDPKWEGFQEIDRAITENRLTAYTWKKTWADPWGKAGLVAFFLLLLAFVIYVIIYDGLL